MDTNSARVVVIGGCGHGGNAFSVGTNYQEKDFRTVEDVVAFCRGLRLEVPPRIVKIMREIQTQVSESLTTRINRFLESSPAEAQFEAAYNIAIKETEKFCNRRKLEILNLGWSKVVKGGRVVVASKTSGGIVFAYVYPKTGQCVMELEDE